MKTWPANKQEWMTMLASPFKVFVLSFGFIYYLCWSPYPFPQFTPWAIAYFVAFFVLMGIAAAQAITRHFRDAIWSSLFAVLAMCIVVSFIFYPKIR
jgi:hypothetical protein